MWVTENYSSLCKGVLLGILVEESILLVTSVKHRKPEPKRQDIVKVLALHTSDPGLIPSTIYGPLSTTGRVF